MDILTTGLMILCGLWLADFGTATVHWAVDNYADPEWPFIGPHYVFHSHNHHNDPMALFKISLLERHGFIVCFVTVTGLILAALDLINTFTLSALIFGGLTNVIHGWSHHTAEENGPMLTALHKLGLFQSPKHHVHHHIDENGSHYALLTDHVNPVLEAVGLFPFLEKVIKRCGLQSRWWESASTS